MTEVEEIARGLNTRQRKFLRAASVSPKNWRSILRHAKIGRVKRLPLGLMVWEAGLFRISDLGLRVRAHLAAAGEG